MISYINERLNIGIIYETVGSAVGWDTTIINRDNGFYLPIERQSDSIGRFNIGDRLFSKAEWEYLFNFFYNVRGSAIAFKYKDWGDYQAINQAIADADGAETEFQLIKTYSDYFKPIYKPVASTIKIYLEGVLQTSGYTVNSVGLVTFTTAPASGVAISADFEFDLVVRFENDNLSSRFDAYDPNHPEEALYNVPSIFLIEVLPIDNTTFASGWRCENGVCVEDTEGFYRTQEECEAALAPANFTGGQCVGISYSVTIDYYRFIGAAPSNPALTGNFTQVVSILGAIVSITPIFNNIVGTKIEIISNSGSTITDVGSVSWSEGSFIEITSILLVRSDGLPDNCGNPAPSCPF